LRCCRSVAVGCTATKLSPASLRDLAGSVAEISASVLIAGVRRPFLCMATFCTSADHGNVHGGSCRPTIHDTRRQQLGTGYRNRALGHSPSFPPAACMPVDDRIPRSAV